MSPTFISAIAASVSTLIAIGALLLSLYNYRRAKDEPSRIRQQQIRDNLRAILEPAQSELNELVTAIDIGRSLPTPTPAFLSSHRFVDALSKRRADVLERTFTLGVSISLSSVGSSWTAAESAQSSVAKATASLDERISAGPSATMDSVERARKVVRDKDGELRALMNRLRKQAGKALDDVSEEILRLNVFEQDGV